MIQNMGSSADNAFAGQGMSRSFFLPRLPEAFYKGDAVVHWTMPVKNRDRGWLNQEFHCLFRELLAHTAVREHLVCPVYCLMPDHVHFIWMGLRLESDQRRAMAFLRTYVRKTSCSPRFQHQAHDHVLKEQERRRRAFGTVCYYIAENPVRAGLVQTSNEWIYSGSMIPGYPRMHILEEGFWPKFWKIYSQARMANAGELRRTWEGQFE